MLLKKLYEISYIDDDRQIKTFSFSEKTEVEAELTCLKAEGMEAWLESKTIPIQD